MSKTPYPINIATGLRKGNPADIYGQQPKKESGTVTVPSKFFETSELPRRRNRPRRPVNYNDMRDYLKLSRNPRFKLRKLRGSVAKRSARRGSATRSATESATRSVEGGKRTRKYNKKHKKTKKRRGKKRRTMRR